MVFGARIIYNSQKLLVELEAAVFGHRQCPLLNQRLCRGILRGSRGSYGMAYRNQVNRQYQASTCVEPDLYFEGE
jgi:hypothetical protein